MLQDKSLVPQVIRKSKQLCNLHSQLGYLEASTMQQNKGKDKGKLHAHSLPSYQQRKNRGKYDQTFGSSSQQPILSTLKAASPPYFPSSSSVPAPPLLRQMDASEG